MKHVITALNRYYTAINDLTMAIYILHVAPHSKSRKAVFYYDFVVEVFLIFIGHIHVLQRPQSEH